MQIFPLSVCDYKKQKKKLKSGGARERKTEKKNRGQMQTIDKGQQAMSSVSDLYYSHIASAKWPRFEAETKTDAIIDWVRVFIRETGSFKQLV